MSVSSASAGRSVAGQSRAGSSALLWVVLTSACGGGSTGGGTTGGGGQAFDGESDPPQPGYYEGEALQFRLLDDGMLIDFDAKLTCTCEGTPKTLDGRIREGGALGSDGISLVPIVNRGAALRIDGAFTDATHVAGTYDYQCCQDVAWSASQVDEAVAPAGVCAGQPDASAVPVGATAEGATLHWKSPTTCIALSRSPGLAGVAERITAAARAWELVDCSPLCFEALTEATDGPTAAADRRLHFTLADAEHPIPGGARAATVARVRPLDGEITGATITLGSAVAEDDGLEELLRQIGRALGYEQAPDLVDSVLAAASTAQSLTAADEAALCAMYGETPYCRE